MMRNCCGFMLQSQRRYRTAVTLRLTIIAVLLISLSLLSQAVFRFSLARSRPPHWLEGSGTLEVEPTGLVVDTRSCQIPDFDAYNPSISQYMHEPHRQLIVCNHSLPITFTDGQYIRLNTTLTTSVHIQHCLYQQVLTFSVYIR